MCVLQWKVARWDIHHLYVFAIQCEKILGTSSGCSFDAAAVGRLFIIQSTHHLPSF